jgi:Xaa-Pro aminopeptidase
MEKKNIDAIVASTPINIQYLTNVPNASGFAVLPRNKSLDPFFITSIGNNDKVVESDTWMKDIRFRGGAYYWEYEPGAELTEIERKMKENYDSAIMDVIIANPWTSQTKSMRDELVEGLMERGLETGNIGIEEKGTTLTNYQILEKTLPEATLVLADDAFAYSRQVKTPYEIELFEELVPIVDEGWRAICDAAKPGVTEGELLKAYKKSVVSHGDGGCGVDYNFHVAIGRRTIMSFSGTGKSRNAKLQKGDLISFNGGIVYKNHPTHHSRTAVLGKPRNPKINKYYHAVLSAENAGLEILKPGVKASEVYHVMLETAKEIIPFFRRHHMGHAIGLETYDTPNFLSNEHTTLEEGMVFNIEPSAFQVFGVGAIRLEDTLVITKKGHRLLTATSRELEQL